LPAAYPKEITSHKLYNIWRKMKSNASRTNTIICEDWKNVSSFYSWGVNIYSENLEFARIDLSKGYSPENCDFTDSKTITERRILGVNPSSLLGQTFNYLTIISKPFPTFKNGKNHSTVFCLCKCENTHTVDLSDLKSGQIKSCGCYNIERSLEVAQERRKYERGATDHPLYRVWQSINELCRKENIEIHKEWTDYIKFYDWVINDYVKGLCFSRIDNSLGFTPDNCKFMDYKELTSKNDYDEIMVKMRKTNLETYGIEFPQKLDWVKDKTRETNIEKFGGPASSCSPEVRKKTEESNLKRFGFKHATQNQEIKDKTRKTSIESGRIKLYRGKTIYEWAVERGQNYQTLVYRINKYGFDMAIEMGPKESGIESIIRLYLEKQLISFKQEVTIKDKNNHRRADFVIDDFNLIIEADGLHWHSDNKRKFSKGPTYHKGKFDFYTSKGYQSLFFYEDEIELQLPIVEHIIKQSCQNKTELGNDYAILVGDLEWLDTRHLKKSSNANNERKLISITKDGITLATAEYHQVDNGVVIDRFAQEAPYSNLLHILMKTLRWYGEVSIWRDNRTDKFTLPFEPIQNRVGFSWARDDRRFDAESLTEQEALESRCNKIWDCGSDLFILR
jgi:very-short-patch-repair endonuclease